MLYQVIKYYNLLKQRSIYNKNKKTIYLKHIKKKIKA